MRIRTAAMLSLLGVVISVAPAFAGPVGVARTFTPQQREATLTQLQQKKLALGQQMPATPKGVPLLRWTEKRTQLQEVIDRVNNEAPVSQNEIDRVLE